MSTSNVTVEPIETNVKTTPKPISEEEQETLKAKRTEVFITKQ